MFTKPRGSIIMGMIKLGGAPKKGITESGMKRSGRWDNQRIPKSVWLVIQGNHISAGHWIRVLGKPKARSTFDVGFFTKITTSFHKMQRWCKTYVIYSRLIRSRLSKTCPSPGQWKCQTKYFGVKLPGIASPSRRFQTRATATKSAPLSSSKLSPDHAIRRHMQNDLRKCAPTKNEKSGKDNHQLSW